VELGNVTILRKEKKITAQIAGGDYGISDWMI